MQAVQVDPLVKKHLFDIIPIGTETAKGSVYSVFNGSFGDNMDVKVKITKKVAPGLELALQGVSYMGKISSSDKFIRLLACQETQMKFFLLSTR